MAKVLFRNKLGNTTKTSALPCSATDAVTIVEAVTVGEYAIFENTSTSGTDSNPASYRVASLMLKSLNEEKTYVNIAIPSTKGTADIKTAFEGTTVNGVLVEEIVVLSLREIA